MRFCLTILLLVPFGLLAQELPPIQTFSPSDYQGENQNWAISQSMDKFIYVANDHSLMEFDGVRWNKYASPNGSSIRNVKVVGNKIYTGCYMEFGYWTKDSTGKLNYTSLVDKLSRPLLEDEEFWNIVAVEDRILFQSLHRIYIYPLSRKEFRIVEAETDKAQLFNLESGVYFQRKNQGIFKITENTARAITEDERIKNKTVIGLFEDAKGLIYLTSDAEWYREEKNGKLVAWDIPANTGLSSLNIYSSLQLGDGSFILGTISNGMYQISKEGRLIRKIDQQQGLNNNTILAIFEDKDSNVWLGHDNGLSVINLDSHFNEYIDNVGKLGVVYASKVFEDKLYLGTNQGLFWTEKEGVPKFKLVPGTEGQVWCLPQIGEALFCGHHKGTFVIEGDTAKMISKFPGTWNIKPIAGKPNYLLQGNYGGLSVLEKSDGLWTFRNKLKGFDNSSRFFEFSGKDTIYVNHEFKGVFGLKIDDDLRNAKLLSKEEGKGKASSLVRFNGALVYATVHAVFDIDTQRNQFVVDTALTNIFHEDQGDEPSILITDGSDKKLWRFGKQDIMFAEPSKFDDGYNRTVIAVPRGLRNNLGVSGFENIGTLGDEKYLIGASNGYVTLNRSKLKPSTYSVLLNEVKKYRYGDSPENIPLDTVASLKNQENSLLFSYSVPEYDKYKAVAYQYRLIGMHEDWSEWTTVPEVSFENLPFGEYTFVARAKVGNTMTDNEISYTFSIERPWYWSIVAIAFYILAILGFSVMVHKLYKRYYKKQQAKIMRENERKLKRKRNKAKRKIVQIKNEKLRNEIEAKNRELAVATMSMIKKNEFLNSIKSQLTKTENSAAVGSVIKMIDRNIDNGDDWKFFEKAFNNADTGFLKKIKELHPDLTSNDLKLCAYLRLNLSSKEIAPLLNISVKSVEVKRYRLRKKMQLEHENSLTEYLLNI